MEAALAGRADSSELARQAGWVLVTEQTGGSIGMI